MESLAPASDVRARAPSVPPESRSPAPGVPPVGALPTSATPPGSCPDRARTPFGSARIAPPWLSCSPIRPSFRAQTPETRYTALGLQVGPNQTRKRGQFRVANSNGGLRALPWGWTNLPQPDTGVSVKGHTECAVLLSAAALLDLVRFLDRHEES